MGWLIGLGGCNKGKCWRNEIFRTCKAGPVVFLHPVATPVKFHFRLPARRARKRSKEISALA